MEATVVAQELVGSHLSYARSVLLGPPAAVARGVLYPSSGVLAILATIGQAFAVVILLHATLPSPTTPSLQLCRLSCLAFLLALLFPIAFDRERFSLGGDFRDIAIPSFVWLPLAEALKICLVSIWQSPGERAPHWIVPEDKARHWPGAVKIDALPGAHRRSSVTSTYSTRFRVPQVWYRVPHPPLWSWRRLAWALDNLALRRPGTSWLLPSEQRAMEWGYKPIVAAAAVYDDAAAMQTSEREKCKRRREADIWFGQLEWGWIGSSLQLLSLIAIFRYIRSLDMRVVNGPFTLGHLSLMDQYLLTLGLGCIVAFTFSPIEYLLYPILLHVFGFPATAISPTFQRPLISSGPTEFWSRRWHQWLRRDFSTLARLFPGGSESRRLRALWTFSVSAMEHSEFLTVRLSRMYH